MAHAYFCLNNKFYSKKQAALTVNRAMRFGDGLFETIRIVNGIPRYLELHIARLKNGLEALQIEFSSGKLDELRICINQLLIKNELEESGILRIIAFRAGQGKYLPNGNELAFYIETEALEEKRYSLNKKGISIGFSKQIRLTYNQFSSLKTLNALPYIMASKEKEKSEFDELILLNNEGRIVEATSSNIFLVFKGKVITPPLTEGCVDGVMRKSIIHLLSNLNITIDERPIFVDELMKADEVFLTNSVNGVKWVGAHHSKRYFKKISHLLVTKI